MICISHGFPGDMEFSPTSSPYPAQSCVAVRAGFGDEWEKTHLSWKTMWNAFSPILHHLFCPNKPICNNNKLTATAILNIVSTHNTFQIVKYEYLPRPRWGLRGIVFTLSVCVSVCLCVSVCSANILVFYFSAIRRDIDLKCIQDTKKVVLN